MTLLKVLSIIGLLYVIAVVCPERDNPTEQFNQQQKQTYYQAVEPTSVESTQVTGIVKHTEKGVSIVSETGSYVAFGEDFTEMFGKKVKAEGMVAEINDKQVIRVIAVMPME